MRHLIYEIGQIYQLKITTKSSPINRLWRQIKAISGQRPQDVPSQQIFIVKISFFRDQIGKKGIVYIKSDTKADISQKGFLVSISSDSSLLRME
jgi:hypothetical protein